MSNIEYRKLQGAYWSWNITRPGQSSTWCYKIQNHARLFMTDLLFDSYSEECLPWAVLLKDAPHEPQHTPYEPNLQTRLFSLISILQLLLFWFSKSANIYHSVAPPSWEHDDCFCDIFPNFFVYYLSIWCNIFLFLSILCTLLEW